MNVEKGVVDKQMPDREVLDRKRRRRRKKRERLNVRTPAGCLPMLTQTTLTRAFSGREILIRKNLLRYKKLDGDVCRMMGDDGVGGGNF